MTSSGSQYIVDDLESLQEIAALLIPKILEHRIVTFQGELGTGKTTLIKIICKQLGIEENVSSPTFSIINEYHNPDGNIRVYHMDLYRLESEMEVINIGFEEYLDSGDLVFIEWPEIAQALLPSNSIGIHIEIFDKSRRKLKLI